MIFQKSIYFDFFESGFCAEVALAIRYAIYALMFPAKSLLGRFFFYGNLLNMPIFNVQEVLELKQAHLVA